MFRVVFTGELGDVGTYGHVSTAKKVAEMYLECGIVESVSIYRGRKLYAVKYYWKDKWQSVKEAPICR